MIETENTTLESRVEPQTRYEGRRGAPRRVPGERRATAAVVLSALSLLVSCVSLALLLKYLPQRASAPEPEETREETPEPETPTIQYRNHLLPILEDVPVNGYDVHLFERDENGYIRYQDAPLGIDVSSYQGEIDWAQTASAVDFVMIRLGLRGYTKGGIMEDTTFARNIRGALDAGLDVGVYFFSQAVNEQEAEEEADFVLEHIAGYELTYPVVFDWESVADTSARTNRVSSDEVTRCAAAFCRKIAAAGYTPMIYFNMDQGYLAYQLDKLTEHYFWLAEYHESPGFYYDFDFWQYTHQGSVPGIDGAVDLDLDLRGYGQESAAWKG